RNHIENYVSEKVAMQICSRLAKNQAELEELIQTGYSLAENMSWDMVVKNYLLNSLKKIHPKQPGTPIYS
ncbi:MAG: hypothetical protein ACYSRZ_09165, partial [Planctomycetota bacterium]